jgi:hypothetical protein
MAISLFSYTKSADKYGPIETTQVQQLQNEPGTLGNLGRAAGSGALSAVRGIFDFAGADGIARQFYGSYKRAVEDGDVVRQQELKEDEAKSLSSRVHLSSIQRQLSQLSK